MIDLYGSHFEYYDTDGTLRSSRTDGLIFANVETSRFNSLSGTVSSVTVFNKSNKKKYLVDTDYSDYPVNIDIEIVTDDDRCLSVQERRSIERWLFNRHSYRKLYLDVDDGCEENRTEIIDGVTKRLYLNCRFINPTKLEYNGGVVGYQATLETDSGMWWQDAVEQTVYPSPGTSRVDFLDITVDTDIDDYTYPLLTIRTGSEGGIITIVNTSDSNSRIMRLVNAQPNTNIVLDGELNYISNHPYSSFYKQNFPRLVNGTNTIAVTGDVVSLSYSFNNRRRF